MLLNVIEALVFGFGVAFLIFGYPLVRGILAYFFLVAPRGSPGTG